MAARIAGPLEAFKVKIEHRKPASGCIGSGLPCPHDRVFEPFQDRGAVGKLHQIVRKGEMGNSLPGLLPALYRWKLRGDRLDRYASAC